MKISRILKWSLAVGCFLGGKAQVCALERLEPAFGCYFGFNLGSDDTVERLSSRLGVKPAVFAWFVRFPLSAGDRDRLSLVFANARSAGAIAMLTLEPFDGLNAVTGIACRELAELCAAEEARGIAGILLRFGHEMNGNWYPWGQRPKLYREKFRLTASHIHERTVRTAMLWSPNYGIGYPFGTPVPERGTEDYLELDTNRDGIISDRDDMYEPYYPGDDAVDWVGMTIYHWGVEYPWGKNAVPAPRSFARAIGQTSEGHVPNFYARYCADGIHNKPMAIAETSAMYIAGQSGPSEFQIKSAWLSQVYNISGDTAQALDIASHFPKLKCVNWFDHRKQESEVGDHWVDWRITADAALRGAFLEKIETARDGRAYFLSAHDLICAAEGALRPDAHGLRVEIQVCGRRPVLAWHGETGRRYTVEWTDDLGSGAWRPLQDVMPGVNGPLRLALAFDGGKRYFRVRQE